MAKKTARKNLGRPGAASIYSIFTALLLTTSPYAHAQLLPAECTPQNPVAGDVINCVSADRNPIGPIVLNQDGITLNIGTETNPTPVDFPALSAIRISGSNGLSVNIFNPDSFIRAGGDGIFLDMRGGSGNLNLMSEGAIWGFRDGVVALQQGVGAININVTDVAAQNRNGIFVQNGPAGTSIDVRARGPVTSRGDTILITNAGTSSTTVSVIDVTSWQGTAIDVVTGLNSEDLVVESTGVIAGANSGMDISNFGQGHTLINVHDVIGSDTWGINVSTRLRTTGLAINSSGSIEGRFWGIVGYNNHLTPENGHSAGDFTIDVVDVMGAEASGIFALNGLNGENLSITSTGTVSGADSGVQAINLGAGALNISVHDAVGADGINADNHGTDVNIISTGTINSDPSTGRGFNGIFAVNRGSGDMFIDVNDISGTAFFGVHAINRSSSNNLNIIARGDISSEFTGINAFNQGRGDFQIHVLGNVMAGTAGVWATGEVENQTIIVDGSISAGTYGVISYALNGTDIWVNEGGSITSDQFAIITSHNPFDDLARDQLFIAGDIQGQIQTQYGDDTVTLFDSATLTGGVFLQDDNDTLNYHGASFDFIRGGRGTDTFNFNEGGGVITGNGEMDAISEFEIYNFNSGGFTLSGVHSGLESVNFLSGTNGIMGDITASEFNVSNGASLWAIDGGRAAGQVTNSGTVSLTGAGPAQFSIDGDYAQTAMGALNLNVDENGAADLLTVTGLASLGGALNVSQADIMPGTIRLIDAQGGLSGAFSNVNLEGGGGLLLSQSIEYDPDAFDVNLVTVLNDAGTLTFLSGNQQAAANVLMDLYTSGQTDGGLSALARRTGVLSSEGDLSATLNAIVPHEALGGIQSMQFAGTRFSDTLLSRKSGSAGKYVWSSARQINEDLSLGSSRGSFDTEGIETSFGVSNIILGEARLGMAFGYSTLETDFDQTARDKTETEILHAGLQGSVPLGGVIGNFAPELDGTFIYSSANTEIDRRMSLSAINIFSDQIGDSDIEALRGQARLSLRPVSQDGLSLTPHLFAAVDSVRMDSFSLGSGAAALDIDQSRQDRWTFGAGLSGSQFVSDAIKLSAQATAMRHAGDTRAELSSGFSASPSSARFITQGADVKQQLNMSLGLETGFSGTWTARLGGDVWLGDIEGYAGTFKVTSRF